MPAAVGFSTYVAIARAPGSQAGHSLRRISRQTSISISTTCLQQRTGAWCDYVLGVATVLQQAGHQTSGREPVRAWRSSDWRGTEFLGGAGSRFRSCLDEPRRDANAASPTSPSSAAKRRTLLSAPGSASWISSSPAWAKQGTLFFSIAALWSLSSFPFPPASRSWFATPWSSTIWPPAPTTLRREECEEGVRYFAEMGSHDPRSARCVRRTAGAACQRTSRHHPQALLPRRPRKPADTRRRPRSYRRRSGASGKR